MRFVPAVAFIALVTGPALAADDAAPAAAAPAATMPAPGAPVADAPAAPSAAAPGAPAAAAPAAPGAAAADAYTSLPAGEGRDVTVRVCAQCHSPEVVAHQNLDAQGWKDLVNQMANNGANATDAEFATISKYLTTAFPQH